ncbi:MAG: hypothetical protein RIS70_2073, partial [Planctomycetota bacterium]
MTASLKDASPADFSSLGLSEPLLRAIADAGYQQPTPIQARSIPPILDGQDLIGCAQTGTGKTAAFVLPAIERLCQSHVATTPSPRRELPAAAESPRRPHHPSHHHQRHAAPQRDIRMLILAPTRELANQIADCVRDYGRHTPLRSTVIFGGVSQERQV